MASYADVNGVRMWYDERGGGEPVVLLHGGLTDSRDFTGNLEGLAGEFRLLLPERRGHGHTADMPGPMTFEVMARDTIAFQEQVVGQPTALVGYSAGAAVALRAAVRRPDLITRLALVSGAFDASGMLLRPAAATPPPPPLLAAYAEVSPDGADHFGVVIGKLAESAATEPGLTMADLRIVGCPVLVMAADDDLVTLEHTITMYRALPDAQLAIVPGTSHLLLHERPELCTTLVSDFLQAGPVLTRMPISRAAAAAGPADGLGHPAALPLPAGLSKPAQRALAGAGYTSLNNLGGISETEIADLHGIGPNTITLLRRALAAAGLSFAR